MKGTPKKQAQKTNPQVSPTLLKEGAKPLGPGVVKRAKRDNTEAAGGGGDPSYTPSEQVFRRRT
jgi:hypothetical protein